MKTRKGKRDTPPHERVGKSLLQGFMSLNDDDDGGDSESEDSLTNAFGPNPQRQLRPQVEALTLTVTVLAELTLQAAQRPPLGSSRLERLEEERGLLSQVHALRYWVMHREKPADWDAVSSNMKTAALKHATLNFHHPDARIVTASATSKSPERRDMFRRSSPSRLSDDAGSASRISPLTTNSPTTKHQTDPGGKMRGRRWSRERDGCTPIHETTDASGSPSPGPGARPRPLERHGQLPSLEGCGIAPAESASVAVSAPRSAATHPLDAASAASFLSAAPRPVPSPQPPRGDPPSKRPRALPV